MHAFFLPFVGLFSAASWLVLLEVTNFNACAVAAGLLGMLVATGQASRSQLH